MLSRIKDSYQNYIDIYENVLPTIKNDTAKRFLENSLYLSVFTSFEYFIKQMIDDYVNKKQDSIRYIDLNESLARIFMLESERKFQVNNIYDQNEERSRRFFKAYFKKIKDPLTKQDLSRHIKFEFFHESKLNSHYKVIFEQILGVPTFLEKIKIVKNNIDNGIEYREEIDGFTFISNYCKDIRNNIAHSNDNYSISSITFQDVIIAFEHIMEEINREYERYNGFPLSTVVRENILDNV